MTIEKKRHSQINGKTEAAKKDEKTEEKPEEKKITITESDLDALISRKIAEATKGTGSSSDIVEALRIFAEANVDKKPFKYDPFEYREPDANDLLEKPKVYWAMGYWKVLGDDRQNGQSVPAPFGPVIFKPDHTNRVKSGKEENVYFFSKHVCISKKELAFLEKHSLRGIVFFEHIDDTQTVDTRLVSLLSKYVTGLRSTNAHSLFAQAKLLGIPMTTTNPDEMRLIMATKLANDEFEKVKESAKVRLRQNEKEDLVAKKQ